MASAQRKLDLISSEHVVGAAVHDRSGKEIGEIDHLMIDPETGQTRYAIVNFCGFMCLRKGHHAVPWRALCYDKDARRYTADITSEQLEQAPELDSDSWTDRDWESRIHRHYGAQPYWEIAEAR
jgi:sporulation protein YlmC with PRC-barrel domain